MSARPVPLPILERIAAGEVDGAAWGVDVDDARVIALRAANDEMLRAHPARVGAAIVRERLAREATGKRRQWVPALALAASLGAVAIVTVGTVVRGPAVASVDGVPDDNVILKGGPELRTWAVRDGASVLVDEARAGETLQLARVAGGAAYGVIVSIDGRGGVTLHWPESPSGNAALVGDGEQRLPHGFVLDDAPRFERFIFVTADRPIDVEGVVAAARQVAQGPRVDVEPLALEQGQHQTTRLVKKVAP